MKARLFVALVASIVCSQAASQGAFVLTAAGTSRGLGLSTFATEFPSNNNVGPLGVAYPTSGGVLVSDYLGNVRLFATNADNQLASAAPISQNYGFANAVAMSQVGGSIYMTQQSLGRVVQINNNGTLNQLIVGGLSLVTGLVANPLTGTLFASVIGTSQIVEIDPIAKTVLRTLANSFADGLSISANGSIVYGANSNTGHLLGWRTSDGLQVFDSGFISGGIDGTAFGAGPLLGNVYVNNNNGTLVEVNLTSLVQTVIGTGGSRGDFVSVDPTNNSLLITQTDRILRITGPFQGNPPPNSVPAPPAFALFAIGGVLMAAKRMWDGKAKPAVA